MTPPTQTTTADATTDAATASGRHRWLTELWLALALLLAGAGFHHLVEYDNTSSRYFLLSAAVDDGTLAIDRYRAETADLSTHDGHAYSNKAIGASLLAAPAYWLYRRATAGHDEAPLSGPARWLTKVVAASLPTALLGVVLFRLAIGLGAERRAAVLMVGAYGFGTLAWVHDTLFSGHQLSAALGLAAFAGIWRLTAGFKSINEQKESVPSSINAPSPAPSPSPTARWRLPERAPLLAAFATGLAAGGAVLADYLAGIAVVAITAYALARRLSWTRFIAYLAGGGLMAALLAGYNTLCFGAPWRLSYGMQATTEFAAGSSRGFFGVALPDPGHLVSLLVSPSRGLFFIMPVLLLGVAGLVPLWRRGWRAECLTIVVIAVGWLLANAGFYGWHSGWSYGPRYLTDMLPFLALPIAFVRVARPLGLAVFSVSLVQILPVAVAMPHTPETLANPLSELVLPFIGYGYVARTAPAILGLDPLAGVALTVLAVAALMALAIRREVLAVEPDVARPPTTVPVWQQAMLGIWLVAVVVSLATVHSPATVNIHTIRVDLLDHAWLRTQDATFRRAMSAERDLQMEP